MVTKMLAIYKREIKSYFMTPLGYVFCAMFLMLSGLAFSYTILWNENKTTEGLGTYFTLLLLIFAVLLPLLTMKLFSEDKKSRSEQSYLTAPVSLLSVVMGKYLAAISVYAAAFLVNSLNFFLLYIYGTPNAKSILANIFGVFLLGCAFIAIGIFLSSITENQLVAAVSSICSTLALIGVSFIADSISIEWIRVVVKWFSVLDRYAPFSNDILDIAAIFYFLSLSGIFIFLTVRVFEKRRWS